MAELWAAEDRADFLEAILGSLNDTPVVVLDRDGLILSSWSTAGGAVRYRMEGFQVGRTRVDQVLPPEQAAQVLAAVDEVYRSGEAQNRELSVRLPAGEFRFDLRLSPICAASGEVRCVVVVSRDITEPRRAMDALGGREQQLSGIVAAVSEMPIALLDRDGGVVSVLHREETDRRHGLKQTDVVGMRLGSFLKPPETVRAYLKLIREVWETGESRRTEGWLDFSTGRVCFDTVFSPIFAASGEVEAVLAVNRNATERKRNEAELAQHRDHLEALVEERTAELELTHRALRHSERLSTIGTLAAGIAHQINNPVGAMLLAAQVALESGDVPPKLARVLNDIAIEAKRCKEIVSSLRRFAMEGSSEKAPADPNEIARAAANLLEKVAERAGAHVEVSAAEAPPAIDADAIALQQALVNLLRNAIEAGAKRILLRTEAVGDEVRFTVEDDGHGIAEQYRERVLDPFFTTRQHRGGTGLGLSVAHGIASDHGGTLELRSREETGTTATLCLPRGACSSSTVQGRAARHGPAGDAGEWR